MRLKLVEYIRLALSEIFHNKVRTFLTLIGIIIGIGAVIIIVFVVQGAEKFIMGELERIAPVDVMMVYGRYDSQTHRFLGHLTGDDIKMIEEKEGDRIRAMAPRYWYNGELVYKGEEQGCDIIPTTPSFQNIYGLKLARGRFLTNLDVENLNQVIVLGHEIAEKMFENEDPLNKKVTLFGSVFTVVGVLPEDYQSPILSVSVNDRKVFIPISVVERFGGFKNRFNLLIRLKDRSYMPQTVSRIQNMLDAKYGMAEDGKSRFFVRDLASGLEVIGTIKIVLMVLLSGVASITLLVAGIGVMNIMLVIVTERTKEIGLRKALGATRKDILIQFIIESIILCLVGGIMGIGLGYLGSGFALNLANNFVEMEAEVPFWAVILSLLFTTGVGLFFGIYPAAKASRLDPIQALHYE